MQIFNMACKLESVGSMLFKRACKIFEHREGSCSSRYIQGYIGKGSQKGKFAQGVGRVSAIALLHPEKAYLPVADQ